MGCRICELLSDQSEHAAANHHVIMTPPNHMLLPQIREMLLAAYLLRGYYQPAGPLISAHHHHSLPKPSALPTLEASPTSTPPTAPPPISASTSSGTRGGDESSDNDVVITATSCSSNNNNNNVNPPSQALPPTYRYPPQSYPSAQHVHHQYHQYPPPPPPPPQQQYYPGAVQGMQYAGAPPAQHHYHSPPDLCYTTAGYPPAPPYYHHKSYSTPPPVSYPRRYGPPHPSQYYPPELYSQPPDQQSSRQMVATASTSGYQPPVDPYPPPTAPPVVPMVDPYPPPPAPYYPGYPPPAPPCYSHSPPARSLAYIDTAYQGCPCPMQSCPKNVLTGPLTGEGKGPDPSAAIFHQAPLPPVALALPSEPPHVMGPPSPARGSAGMHPTPSPLATARGNDQVGCFTGKQEPSSESRVQEAPPLERLLTIHKPPCGASKTTVLVAPAEESVGTVNVGNKQTLTCEVIGRPDLKVESVKVEETERTNGRKRRARVDRPEGVARCKYQPLSSANSCSLHHSRQNAKRRKLGDVEVLAENQEPVPIVTDAKEAKSRPKLCPPSRAQIKVNVTDQLCPPSRSQIKVTDQLCPPSRSQIKVKVPDQLCPQSRSQIKVKDQAVSPEVERLDVIAGARSGIIAHKAAPKSGTKPSAKSVNVIMNQVTLGRRKPGKSQLNKPREEKSQLNKPREDKRAPQAKVTRRRQTDSDAARVSHMLRSHGLQEPNAWQTENNLNRNNVVIQAAVFKCKTVGVKKASLKNGAIRAGEVTVYLEPSLKRCSFLKPKWSNGWCWEGESFQAKVHLNSEEPCVERTCYSSMRHTEGDVIRPRDCILLKSGARKADLPFVAKVAQLWENPDDGEMMVSLLWYYRPEHTDQGRRSEDMRDEIFASKHKDTNSVACIEDKCYVLTFNEYCRYRAGARRLQDGLREPCAVVPESPDLSRLSRQPPDQVSSDMVFFCRRVYDFRQKRILKNPG